MSFSEILNQKNFAVLGDTLNPEKCACKIKNRLLENGYNVFCVGKELSSINDIDGEVDVIDLCIHPAKGITLLKECNKEYKYVVIQPGAQSDEIIEFLKSKNIDYIEDCIYKALSK